jgi:peptidoglycan/xylan/chitin deacetylase (PgdA/CDA1 family)
MPSVLEEDNHGEGDGEGDRIERGHDVPSPPTAAMRSSMGWATLRVPDCVGCAAMARRRRRRRSGSVQTARPRITRVQRGRLLLSTTTVLAAAHALPAAAMRLPRLRSALGVHSTCSGGGGVALTFDDGPHPEGTPAVLRALAAHGATATFFVVGEQVARHPAVVREILAAGHRVALHGDRHRNLLRLGPVATRRDLDGGATRIAEVTGVVPTLYRPPYGVLSASALAHARRRGWRTLLWSHWGRDWERGATSESIAAHLTGGVVAGSVLLLHDADHYSAPGSWRATAAALDRVLDHLAALELPVVPA